MQVQEPRKELPGRRPFWMMARMLLNAWNVLLVFLIPVGGGIPAGVLLAKSKGFAWPLTTLLYFVSDVILACAFEPLMLVMLRIGRRSPKFMRLHLAMKQSVEKTIAHYGTQPGPFALILISFGVDPMTGRAAALAAGHNFVLGWTFAILGDMLFFAVLMVSTLYLNKVLGDGTWTAILITAAMLLIPLLVRKVRARFFQRK